MLLLEIQNRLLRQSSIYGKAKLFGNIFIPFTTAVNLSQFSVTLLTIKDVKTILKDFKIFWLLIGYISHIRFFILKKKFPKMLI